MILNLINNTIWVCFDGAKVPLFFCFFWHPFFVTLSGRIGGAIVIFCRVIAKKDVFLQKCYIIKLL